MSDKPQLDTIQKWMLSVVTQPEGVSGGIEKAQGILAVENNDPSALITPSEKLTSAERLAIYNRGYFARLFKCMEGQFPALQYALGEELFRDFSRAYLFHQPSTSYTLADLGKGLADFLAATRPDKDLPPDERESWPDFMIELARLEYTAFRIFDGKGTEEMAALPATIDDANIAPAPDLQVFHFQYPVDWYYYAVRHRENPELPAPAPTYIAVKRHDYNVRMYHLKPLQFIFLKAFLQGHELNTILKEMSASYLSLDELQALLKIWKGVWLDWKFFVAK